MPEKSGDVEKRGKPVQEVSLRVQKSSFSGPLPHPQILAEYDQVLAGSAERIVRMSEKEQDHQHKIDRRSQLLPFITTTIAQILATVVTVAFIGGGSYLLSIDKDIAGYSSLVIGLAPIVFAYITKKDSSKKNEE